MPNPASAIIPTHAGSGTFDIVSANALCSPAAD